MHKILVTGSAGFIGMHTTLKLAAMGHKVTGLDNINHYYDPVLKFSRLQQQGIDGRSADYAQIIGGHPNISFMRLDLEDKENMEKLFSMQKFDIVIHLAAQAGVRYSLENPDAYIGSNITGFLNILECCRKFPVRHLVYASSSSVYGLNSNIPFKESDATAHPVSLYAATKKSNEMMAHSYANLYDIPVTGLRFFTVYGPWGRPDMALFKFTKNILENKAIDVYNHGDMQRDFTYIDDIVNGICQVAEYVPSPQKQHLDGNYLPDESTAPYAIYNIGNSKPINLLDFVRALEKSLGKEALLNMLPLQPGDVPVTFADTTKLQNIIGYKPVTSIDEGISQFVNWYKSYFEVG